jgi:hypothetical protein
MQEKTRKLEENARMVGQCQGQCQENKVNAPQHREIASHIFVGDFFRSEYLHYLSQTGVMEAGESVDVVISHSPAL